MNLSYHTVAELTSVELHIVNHTNYDFIALMYILMG